MILKAHGVRLVGVQVAGVDAMRRTLAGEQLHAPAQTIADGVRVQSPGRLTRQICRDVLDDIVTVTEREVVHAMVRLAREENLIAEGAGALSVAAVPKVEGQRKLAVISGGNVDLGQWSSLIMGQRPRPQPNRGKDAQSRHSADMTVPPRDRCEPKRIVRRGRVA